MNKAATMGSFVRCVSFRMYFQALMGLRLGLCGFSVSGYFCMSPSKLGRYFSPPRDS